MEKKTVSVKKTSSKKKLVKNENILDQINKQAIEKNFQDEENELFAISSQIRNVFKKKFGESEHYHTVDKMILHANSKDYQKIISHISKLPFSEEEFNELIELVQNYRNIKNNSPEMRGKTELLSAIMQLFLQDLTAVYTKEEITQLGKEIQDIFFQWLKEPHHSLNNFVPYDVLKEVIPEEELKKIGISSGLI